MNLGVETQIVGQPLQEPGTVSAFSDESWGGDPRHVGQRQNDCPAFQHSLMNLGVETFC